ncbi:MAG: ribosome biogenesis GTPase YlqF [Firmicutes bacterium]|nr:ribosome biogenesis GTPase YlqF [Bacillota bacterium]
MTIENINWYPGHMKKTRELIQENLKLVDVVVELLDARIPLSSRNPIIGELVGDKNRIIVLNKSDLSDSDANKKWKEHFSKEVSGQVVLVDSMRGTGIKDLMSLMKKIEEDLNKERTRQKKLRLMIVGVPNVGKSSLINRLTGRKAAKTGDKPGVTKGKQWLTLENGMQLLDTPGILWPKFEDPKVGVVLAYCGSIKEEILDKETLALNLIELLQNEYPSLLMERYKLEELDEVPLENMDNIARKRGFILPGKRIDYERCARTVLDEFRSGTIGRITLEKVGE